MVARVVWDHEAAGSSPVTSTSGEPPLPNRELHLGEVRDFCCPRFLWASSLFSLAKPGRAPRPRFGRFFCLSARAYSGHLICRPDPGGEPPLPSRELHLGEVRDFCCPRFLWASSLFSLAEPGRTPRSRFGLFFCLSAGACGGCPNCQPMYGLVMAFLPQSYTVVASSRVEEEIQRLAEALAQTEAAAASPLLDQFSRDNQALVILTGEAGSQSLPIPPIRSSST